MTRPSKNGNKSSFIVSLEPSPSKHFRNLSPSKKFFKTLPQQNYTKIENISIMLKITKSLSIAPTEIEMTAIRSQGAGGQNVNKVASAIHLRFDIEASSLPDAYKERLLNLNDQRITKDGIVIIKAQSHRTQDQNREEALQRLQELIHSITTLPKPRRATKPTRSSQRKRLDSKTKKSAVKALRKPIDE